MVSSASFNVSLSGLQAASTRLSAAANNIANQFSTQTRVDGETQNTPYVPQDVVQISQEAGGVLAETRPSDRAPVQAYDPGNPSADAQGLVAYPNVDTAEELVNVKVAENDYKANLRAISVQDEIFEDTLDILA